MQEMSTMMQWVSFVLALILWDKMGAARICDSVMMPSISVDIYQKNIYIKKTSILEVMKLKVPFP